MNTNEQIVHDLAEAWRTLNGYVDYIRGKFNTIKKSGSILTIHVVPGRNAIAIVQGAGEPTYYVIEIKDGKIVKGDLTAFI